MVEEEEEEQGYSPLLKAVGILALVFVILFLFIDAPVGHVLIENGCSPGLNSTIDDRECLNTQLDKRATIKQVFEFKTSICPHLQEQNPRTKCRASFFFL